MPCLRPDLQRRNAGLHRAGREPGPQAVAREADGVDTSSGDAFSDDERHGFTRQPPGSGVAVPINRPEYWTSFDPGNREPAVDGEDWTMTSSPKGDADLSPRAFLIGL